VLRLATSQIEVEVDPDRGADILAIRRPGGANVLATADWASPLRASRSASYGDPVSDWLSEYRGGWQELFPNPGAPSAAMGVPLPFHGEVSTARWEVVEQSPVALTLRTPTRLPLMLERRMRLAGDRPVLLIEETARADADLAVPFLWGHHPAFAAAEGARIDLPAGVRVDVDRAYDPPLGDLRPGASGTWPSVPARDGDGLVSLDRIGPGPTERLAFLSGFGGDAWAAIRGVAPGLGVAMVWDPVTFPCAWFWWEIGGPGHPWHGRSRSVAIEPNTDHPADGLAKAIERGTAHRVQPGDVHQTWITVSLFAADDRSVRGVTRDGEVVR
jgi:hypothetical protein